MAPKRNKKRVVWNNSDCGAETCLRPPGTADWVQCDSCTGWFHLYCLSLSIGDLKEDKDFYCPTCVIPKQQEFDKIKGKLKMAVDELAGRQIEFGGVTIDRDFFKDKKNANPYNYSTDFPPTLRDLSSSIDTKYKTLADFKFDYKEMCKKLTENLKDDYESRIQIVEWELDDVVRDIFEEKTETEDELEEIVETFDKYEEDEVQTEERNDGGLCDNCNCRFESSSIFSCKRSHKICHKCRSLISGAVCPRCLQDHNQRKRLYIDNASSMLFKIANSANFVADTVSPVSAIKRRKSKEAPSQPVIMNVWSCSEESKLKEEPLTLSTVPEEKLGNKIITLISTDIVASPISPEQQPVNYNDTGPDIDISAEAQYQMSPPEIGGQEGLWRHDHFGCRLDPPAEAWAKFNEREDSPRLLQSTASRHFQPTRSIFVPDQRQYVPAPLPLPSQPDPLLVPELVGPRQVTTSLAVDQGDFTTPDTFHQSVQQLEDFIAAEEDNFFQ